MEAAWVKICNIESLEESIPTEIQVADTEVLLLRIGDEVHAVPALCPHMDEQLANGMCEGFTLTCLKHLWQWDIRTGEVIANADIPLKIIPLKLVEGNVFLSLE